MFVAQGVDTIGITIITAINVGVSIVEKLKNNTYRRVLWVRPSNQIAYFHV